MFKTVYALRNKKNKKILNLSVSAEAVCDIAGNEYVDLFHYINYSGDYGRWTTDNIKNILFLKDFGTNNHSLEIPVLQENRSDLEIVAIHSIGSMEILSTRNVPQTTLKYFKDFDEIMYFSIFHNPETPSFYENDKELIRRNIIEYEYAKNRPSVYKSSVAWNYLNHLGRTPKISFNYYSMFKKHLEKINKEFKNVR